MKKIWQKLLAFGKRKEGLYLFLASFLGLAMVFINPPFAGVPDEHAHYLKASAVANGYWRCSGNDQVSQSAFELADKIKPVDVEGVKDQKVSLGKMKREFFSKSDYSQTKTVGLLCGTSFAAYLPQSAGIFLGEKLGLSVLAGFYLARIFNLFVSIFLIFWAIKKIPLGENILIVIALLPMTLQQLASISYDSLHIGFSFLFLAIILNWIFRDKKIILKELFWLALLALIGLNVKGGFLLSLLVFLIPNEKFFNQRTAWFSKIMMVIAGFMGYFLNKKIFLGGDDFPANVNPSEQMAYVLQHPLGFLYSVFNTFYDKFIFFVETFLIKPGWLKVSLPYLFYVFLMVGMVLLIKNSNEKEREIEKLKSWQRWLLFGVFLANFLLVFLALYLGWSRVGAEKVGGVQGRYFLAFAPLLFLAFYRAKISLCWEWLRKRERWFFWLFYLVIFAWFFWFIFGYYYRPDFRSEGAREVRMATTEEVKKAEVLPFIEEVEQKFIAKRGDLMGVKIYFAKKNLSGKYAFSLRDENCQQVLGEKLFETKSREVSSVEWKFALLEEPDEPKTLCLVLEKRESNFSDVKIFPIKEEFGQSLLVDGQTKEGKTLLFDLIYKD